MKNSNLALMAATVAVLAACGGGDDDSVPAAAAPPPAVTAQVPASASASVDGLIAYMMALVAIQADTLEPVDLSSFNPPTSETADATPIN